MESSDREDWDFNSSTACTSGRPEERSPQTAEIDGVDDEPKAQILEDFRQAWHEAMTDKTIPVARLWEGIDDD